VDTFNAPRDQIFDLTRQIGRVPALAEIVRLLELQAGDPATVDKAIVYEQIAVTAANIETVDRLRANTEVWSILYIVFSTPSGTGRYLITGGDPTAAGLGMPILAGGSQLVIRGVDNINNFKMIAETGQTMEANCLLFKAPAWREIAR
jgi:hypothetical protein